MGFKVRKNGRGVPTGITYKVNGSWRTHHFTKRFDETWEEAIERAKAEAEQRKALAKYQEFPFDPTVEQWFDFWYGARYEGGVLDVGTANNESKAKTKATMRKWILPQLGERTVGSLRAQDIREWWSWLSKQVSKNYANWTLMLLRSSLNDAVKMNYLLKSPAAAIKPHKEEIKVSEVVPIESFDRFMRAALDSPSRPAIALMLFGGLRLNEARNAKWEDLEVRENDEGDVEVFLMIKRTKEKVDKKVELPARILRYLPSNDERYISPRQSPRTIQLAVRRAGTECGLGDITPHTLRASCARALIDMGVPVRKVQEQLGHQALTTTERYLKRAGSHQGSASAFDRAMPPQSLGSSS